MGAVPDAWPEPNLEGFVSPRAKVAVEQRRGDGQTQSLELQVDLLDFFADELLAGPPKPGQARVFLLVGKAGSGKSTLLAKIAQTHRGRRLGNRLRLRLASLSGELDKALADIDPAEKTALLLDSLDENPGMGRDAERFLDKVLEATKALALVVLAIDPAYLPEGLAKPGNRFRFEGSGGPHELVKLEILPFDDEQKALFFSKKYPALKGLVGENAKRKQHALAVAKNLPGLSALPLWLDLLERFPLEKSLEGFDFYYQICQTLAQDDAPMLRELALDMLLCKRVRQAYACPPKVAEPIALSHRRTPDDLAASPFLWQDRAQAWRFGSRLFLEYFWAEACFDQPELEQQINFDKARHCRQFLDEIFLHRLALPFFSARRLEGRFMPHPLPRARSTQGGEFAQHDLAALKPRDIENIALLAPIDFPAGALRVLRGLPRLESLALSWHELTELAQLGELNGLRVLHLKRGPLESLRNARLPRLEEAYLAHNRLRDLGPLRLLPRLTHLDLEGNAIEQIDALLELPNLRFLNLRGNPLGPSALALLPKLAARCELLR